jgi:CubicO group peptidase (beta-lactamase class C family)
MTILPVRRAAAQIAGLSILAWATATAQSTDAASMIARIEAAQVPNRQGFDGLTLNELMQRFRVPGVSIAVIKDGRIHWAKGYGVADVTTGRLVDTGTVFQAASISKPAFAMTVAKLAQDGRISLDADVNTLLKTWKVPDSEHTRDQKVTLRSLMSHTSGASDGFGFPGYNPDEPRPTLVQIITGEKPSNVGVVRFTRAPYVGFQYSGGGVTLAQLAITDAIGRPLADLADELLLKPLGLTRSSFEQPITDRLAANAAFAHNPGGRRSGPASWHVYPEQAAAGLWTTPSDLARIAIEVQRAIKGPKGIVLTQASARELLSPTGVGGYGVGFGVAQRGQGWYFSHSGGNWGFACNLVAHYRKGYGLVIMTNSDAGGAIIGEIEGRVATAYGWDTLDKPIPR